MPMIRRRLMRVAAFALAATALSLGGCAGEGPVKPTGLEQKIESARTQADFEEIASAYEAQAKIDMVAADRHRRLARSYRAAPSSNRGGQANMALHSENLARTYQQAAEENMSLAKEQRQMTADGRK